MGAGRARQGAGGGAAAGRGAGGDGGRQPRRGPCCPWDAARRWPRSSPGRPGSRLPAASHQERHGCAQKRLLMKSLKSEARAVPWRRRGGCSPAPAAAPPRFRLLFRHPVGSSPIGQFKPPREPLGFRHLGPAPGVTEMPRPTRSSARVPGHESRRRGDARRHQRALPRLAPPFKAQLTLRHFYPVLVLL